MNRNTKIAAAVAAVLAAGAGESAFAYPTLGQAQTPYAAFYISGSSAAKNGVLTAITNDFCGGSGNALNFSSTSNSNFFAVACSPSISSVSGANGTNVFTIYYRDEGGSVTGALPLYSGSPIGQLSLSTASCSANVCTVAVGGSSATNGFDDSFTNITRVQSDLGVTDVEPSALSGDNYPTQYSPSRYGTATKAQLSTLTATPAFQQSFGIFINSTGLHTPISLGREQVQAILSGSLTDWSVVEDSVTHAAVASSSQPITIINREAGSGSRAATSVLFLNDECDPTKSGVVETNPTSYTDYFSTGDVLTAASTTTGAVTYASIDQSKGGLVLASIDGVTPTNLATAQGAYPYWVTSTLVKPNYSIGSEASSISSFFLADLTNGNTAPHAAQVTLIPGSGPNTTPGVPASNTKNTCGNLACSITNATAIYVNPFTKASVCAVPASAL